MKYVYIESKNIPYKKNVRNHWIYQFTEETYNKQDVHFDKATCIGTNCLIPVTIKRNNGVWWGTEIYKHSIYNSLDELMEKHFVDVI